MSRVVDLAIDTVYLAVAVPVFAAVLTGIAAYRAMKWVQARTVH